MVKKDDEIELILFVNKSSTVVDAERSMTRCHEAYLSKQSCKIHSKLVKLNNRGSRSVVHVASISSYIFMLYRFSNRNI